MEINEEWYNYWLEQYNERTRRGVVICMGEEGINMLKQYSENELKKNPPEKGEFSEEGKKS